jgi:uncharacterized membrane protein
MAKKQSILEQPFLTTLISILIILSLALLLINKIGNFPPATDDLFDLLDMIFLGIFTIEFIVKIVFLRGKYFFKDMGWIDLLAALPILTYPVKRILLSSSMDAFLAGDVLSLTIFLRGLKFIRFIRVLRTTRLLKFISIFKRSEQLDRPELSLAVPIIFSLVILLGGYGALSFIETGLKNHRQNEMLQAASVVTEENARQILDSQPRILILMAGNRFERKMGDMEIKQEFRTSECSSVKMPGVYLFYSNADILDLMNRIETILIVFMLLYLVSVFFQYHFQFSRFNHRTAVS